MNTTKEDIARAVECLKKGELVALPTETVYGLGGNALSDEAVAKIYEAKGRPSFNPLIVHIASMEQAQEYAVFNDNARKLAARFWPGPLTLVLPRKEGCRLSLLVSAGLDSVAIRMPSHPLSQSLLHESNLPVAAPSANRSGRVSPTQAAHVREELGDRVAMVLDGGNCPVGIESTVIDLTGDKPVLLRPGSITVEMLREVVGEIGRATAGGPLKSPGMMERHYAPATPIRLNAKDVKEGEALLAFGPKYPDATVMENLSQHGDLREAAANLFRMLRTLDAAGARGIAVMPIPETGLGVAINDRLRRAAT